MITPHPAIQRIFAVILTLLTLWVAQWLLFQWWLIAPLAQISEEEATLRAAYHRYSALTTRQTMVQQQLAEKEKQPLPADSLLAANSPEAATAQIMQFIVERSLLAAEAGLPCSVVNRLPQSASTTGTLIKVTVQAELECGIQSLAATLYRMENTPPYLKIDAFEIRRNSAADENEQRLSARLQISGLLVQPQVINHE